MENKRVNLNLPTDVVDAIEERRLATGMNMTDQIRRSLKLFNYILDLQAEGKQFRVYNSDGSYRVVEILLP